MTLINSKSQSKPADNSSSGTAAIRGYAAYSFSVFSTFLTPLFENKPKESYILLWKAKTKTSMWFKQLKMLIDHLDKASESGLENLYIGCGLSGKNYGTGKRAKAEDIIGISALWADIDVKGEGHTKKNLPETIEDAIGLVDGWGMDPTMIIGSGHGIQPWWVLKEPFLLGDGAEGGSERKVAENALRGLTRVLRERAEKHGWDVDGVSDLARIMRIPGTINVKNGCPPVKAVIIDSDMRTAARSLLEGARFNIEDMVQSFENEGIINDINSTYNIPNRLMAPLPTSAEKAKVEKGLVFDNEKSHVSPLRIEELMNICGPLFSQSWWKRRQFKNDSSNSAYHFSLINYALQANWEDQEIVDMLIQWQRMHNEDMKGVNPKRITHSILKARNEYDERKKEENKKQKEEDKREELQGEILKIEADINTISDNDPIADKNNPKIIAKKKTILEKLIKLPILLIEKFIGQKPTFTITTKWGKIEYLIQDDLASPTRLKNKIAEVIGILIDTKTSKKNWDAVNQLILDLAVDVFLDEEASSDTKQIATWLETYLENQSKQITFNDAATVGKSFYENNVWYLSINHFLKEIQAAYGYDQTRYYLVKNIKEIHPKNKGIKRNFIDVNGLATTRRFWEVH
ncbi:MAG TPA: hypothetical protein VMW95_03420 [Desulfobacterales bacterium]|nr:hypothetical protein [Desulfobacterales bacterium]